MEERPKEPRKMNPFSMIATSLNEIRERCRRTRKVVRAACALVGVEGEDTLIEKLEGLLQKQTVIDLKEKNHKLKEEVKKLKEELADEKKANSMAATKPRACQEDGGGGPATSGNPKQGQTLR